MPHWQSLIQMKQDPSSAWVKLGIMRRGDAEEQQRTYLWTNRWLPASPPISNPDCLLRPLNVLSARPPPTTMTSYFHCCLLPHRPDSRTPQQWCIEMIFLVCPLMYIARVNLHLFYNSEMDAPYHPTLGNKSSVDTHKLPDVFLQLKIGHMVELQQQYKSIERTELLDWLCCRY